MRPISFFFFGRPIALLKYQTILMAVSLASEPELAEERLAHRHRCAGHQHFRQLDHRLVRLGRERVVERQRAHLLGRHLDQPLVGEAERCAPQPGQCIDVALAGIVPHVHALAAGDDHRPDFLMGASDRCTDGSHWRCRGRRASWRGAGSWWTSFTGSNVFFIVGAGRSYRKPPTNGHHPAGTKPCWRTPSDLGRMAGFAGGG